MKKETYSNLYFLVKKPEDFRYKIFIKIDGITSLSAFKKTSQFAKWLTLTGLELPESGLEQITRLDGQFHVITYLSEAEQEAFENIKPNLLDWWMDNGDYTKAKITIDEKTKEHTVHVLNCNVKTREIKAWGINE